MSLTSFLNEKDVAKAFKLEFETPKFAEKRELLAAPVTKHYSLMGMAFDHLMRLAVKRLNPQAVERRWVAETVLSRMFGKYEDAVFMDAGTGKTWVDPDAIPDEADAALAAKIQSILFEAENDFQNYINAGDVTDSLLRSVMLLANLEIVYRTGSVDYLELDVVDDGDIRDLKTLIGIIPSDEFRTNGICLLNPGFGRASKLVGGADADLLIDDALIEIKTTMKLRLERRYFNQLIGYYSLNRIGGMGDSGTKREIREFGIYFSRFGFLYLLNVADHIDQRRFETFLRWFEERAARQKIDLGDPRAPDFR